jgi:hypothetical protein
MECVCGEGLLAYKYCSCKQRNTRIVVTAKKELDLDHHGITVPKQAVQVIMCAAIAVKFRYRALALCTLHAPYI